MTEKTTKNPTLKVSNFGPIADAEVELRPLTVFVGPSNTGKSYLAILLYVLYRALSPGGTRVTTIGGGRVFVRRYIRYDENTDGQFIEELKNLISEVRSADSDDYSNSLKKKVYSFIQGNLPGRDSMIEEEMQRCFGVDAMKDLIRHAEANASVDLIIPQDNEGNALIHQFNIEEKNSNHKLQFPVEIPSEKIKEFLAEFQNYNQGLFPNEDEEELRYSFYGALEGFYDASHGNLPDRTYYLPADRTGVMHSHQVVVSALVQNATTAGLRRSHNIPMLSGVLADFLSELISINHTRGKEDFYHHQARNSRYADLLEKGLLGGEIESIAANQTNYPTFFYRPDGWDSKLSLMRASSMVSELAPIVIYLRHIVVKGNMLIIEEPESHLHPEMQAKLACELARLVNNGYRIVLTTHSEWLLDQIANLVRLSELPEEEKKKHPRGEFALDSFKFGAWRFKKDKNSKGSVVKEMGIDPNKDGLTADYSELMRDLYNEWVDIGNVLAEKGE